ncbi:hypothetical protein EYF80_043941 [Liparis tanakae]|uniref:Uncharacterized protein n=1 Tax=Liparis tanakae TaxID=230148 RepID=A0A4Z2FYR8_9TELE|nr:hypothetical protein EYF80_043941 [Liparis tanakae]
MFLFPLRADWSVGGPRRLTGCSVPARHQGRTASRRCLTQLALHPDSTGSPGRGHQGERLGERPSSSVRSRTSESEETRAREAAGAAEKVTGGAEPERRDRTSHQFGVFRQLVSSRAPHITSHV